MIIEKTRTYAICKAEQGSLFQNPFADGSKNAQQINQTLNLALGRPDLFNRQRNRKLVKVIRFLNQLFLLWWEEALYPIINAIPVSWRRKFVYSVWKIYLPLHKYLLGTSTAIHQDASPEYHAITSVMWFGRYFPVTIPRMRLLLAQLTVWSPPRNVYCQQEKITNAPVKLSQDTAFLPEKYVDHNMVNGIYLKQPSHDAEYVLLWFYGGAFLSGDSAGNVGPAEWIADGTMDVFIPTIRLAPEVNIYGILWDVALAYRYLHQKRIQMGKDPKKILVFGCSSGAALVVRLLQLCATVQRGEPIIPEFLTPLLRDLHVPAGASIVSPFVDYRNPKEPDGSFHQFVVHDLIVNEAVLESGLPYLNTHMNVHPDENHSPLAHSMQGLPPLCVIVSEHETVHDETITLIHHLQKTNIDVTVGYYRYMCHVWCFYHGLIPEGQHSMNLMAKWFREQQK